MGKGAGNVEPSVIGICLSGGGLRAASFALGAIQVLQEQRGLMFGENAARYLSAVSGGSYIAATHTLNARRLAAAQIHEPPPLASGTPEESHVLNNGKYLITPLAATAVRVLLLATLNLVALAVLFVWSGTLLGDAAVLVGAIEPLGPINQWLDALPIIVVVMILALAVFLFVYSLYNDKPAVRRGLVLLPILFASVLAGSTFRGLAEKPPSWRTWAALVALAMAALLLTTGLAALFQKARIGGLPAAALNWTQVVLVRLAGSVLLLWSGLVWYGILARAWATSDEWVSLVLFFGSLLVGVIFSQVPDRASLHGFYRERIRSCFGFDRCLQAVPLYDEALSESWANGPSAAFRSPELLVCATANASNRTTRGRRAFAPFVMAYDACGVVGTDAIFATKKLELGRVRASLLGKEESLISLFSAVAMTGAAVSPSMGRRTVASARPWISALNIRLGRWVPNPFSPRVRKLVDQTQLPRRFDWDKSLGSGWDELVPEMLGLSGTHIYISDGGHYDNLGLLALLQKRCSIIWCVDASPEPDGAAKELRRVLEIARDELGVTSDIDLDQFRVLPDGFYGTTYATGTLTYANGLDASSARIARLHVVKLGMSRESPQPLQDYMAVDKGYPHHGTRRQWYSRQRIAAYRDLGRDSTARALSSVEIS